MSDGRPRRADRRQHEADGDLASLERTLGYRFRDENLLERALVHGSAATEGDLESNQTLEFLGDAVLDLAVSEFLLKRHPGRAEGDLTRMRASIVSAKGLAAAAARLDLGRWIRLGRGEARSGGGKKANILADTYEAVVAAVFLDGGYEAARRVLEKTFAEEVAAADPVGDDWKTELQEFTQARFHCTPSYSLVSATGPDHAKHFEVAIRVQGEVIARGEGTSRKSAEQMAAREAIRVLGERRDDEGDEHEQGEQLGQGAKDAKDRQREAVASQPGTGDGAPTRRAKASRGSK